MASKKYLKTGTSTELFEEVSATQTSAGAGNGGDIVALRDDGTLDITLMPAGIGADTSIVASSENLSAGDLVNLWNDTGTIKARKADATTSGKQADGFVLSAVTSPAPATVYHDGTNAQVTGLTPGKQWLSTTPGKSTHVRPTASGNIQQPVGLAITATSLTFNVGETIKVA